MVRAWRAASSSGSSGVGVSERRRSVPQRQRHLARRVEPQRLAGRLQRLPPPPGPVEQPGAQQPQRRVVGPGLEQRLDPSQRQRRVRHPLQRRARQQRLARLAPAAPPPRRPGRAPASPAAASTSARASRASAHPASASTASSAAARAGPACPATRSARDAAASRWERSRAEPGPGSAACSAAASRQRPWSARTSRSASAAARPRGRARRQQLGRLGQHAAAPVVLRQLQLHLAPPGRVEHAGDQHVPVQPDGPRQVAGPPEERAQRQVGVERLRACRAGPRRRAPRWRRPGSSEIIDRTPARMALASRRRRRWRLMASRIAPSAAAAATTSASWRSASSTAPSAPEKPARTFSQVLSRWSTITRMSASTGMKLLSPPQRGTRCQCRWSTMPAPPALPRFMPTLSPSGR